MKKLLVLSGKGGTGKTTIASALIQLTATDIYADCDVDAPNLHLIKRQEGSALRDDFMGMDKAVIDPSACSDCGLCKEHCRFGAIDRVGGLMQVLAYACEGCGVCAAICPANAIEMVSDKAGELRLYKEVDYFSTAKLKMGSGTSGKLVSAVKSRLKDYQGKGHITVIDGSPGIGCPVIASVSGVDLVLIVAEPTLSGISDMERIIATVKHFHTKCVVCVNKYDMNHDLTESIMHRCEQENIPFVGKLPYDAQVPQLLNEGKGIMEVACEAGKSMVTIYENIMIQLEA